MKKSKFLLTSLLMITSLMAITSCNNKPNSTINDSQTSNSVSSSTGIIINISGANTVEVGATITLSIEVLNDNDRLGYTVVSSDDSVATVSATGEVTGVTKGVVTITVTSRKDQTVYREFTVTVIESTIPTAAINFSSDFMYLDMNTITFSAEVKNAGNFDIIYDWSTKYDKGTFIGNGYKSITYRPFIEGPEIIVLDVYVGPYHLRVEKPFLVRARIDTSWTAISTKKEFTDLVSGITVSAGRNFYLANDIDLEGEVIDSNKYASTAALTMNLDGLGHKVSNFVIGGDSDKANKALIKELGKGAAIRNVAFEGEINQGAAGWGSALLASKGNTGCYIENCSFTVNDSYDNSKDADENGWFAFNAVMIGTGAATITDCVVNVVDCEGKSTIYADITYPADDGVTIVNGLYTNSTVIGGQAWDWGLAVKNQSGYVSGIDFTSTKKDFYKLHELVWNLSDNEVPTLKTQTI